MQLAFWCGFVWSLRRSASPNIVWAIKSRSTRCVRYAACMGHTINGYNILVQKPGRKRPLGIPKHK
jgi:hypothetical protein